MVAGTAPIVDVPGFPAAEQKKRHLAMKKFVELEFLPDCEASVGDMQKVSFSGVVFSTHTSYAIATQPFHSAALLSVAVLYAAQFERKKSLRYKVHFFPVEELTCLTVHPTIRLSPPPCLTHPSLPPPRSPKFSLFAKDLFYYFGKRVDPLVGSMLTTTNQPSLFHIDCALSVVFVPSWSRSC